MIILPIKPPVSHCGTIEMCQMEVYKKPTSDEGWEQMMNDQNYCFFKGLSN